MKNIKDYNLDSLKEEFVQMGERPFRAEQVFKWLYEEKVKEFDEMTNLSLQLREKLKEILKKQGVEMETEASHGGMETGILKGLIPDLDIITYGPIAEGCHTPEEKLNLESFQKAYKNLCDLIAEL